MNPKDNCRVLILAFLFLTQVAFGATLTHRYSFNADASDSVGGADGLLQGTAVVADGMVTFTGTNSFVRLPNDLLTNYDSLSIEVWYADQGINKTNSQLYTFAGAKGSVVWQFAGRGACVSNGFSQSASMPLPVTGPNHLIWTQDAANTNACIYLNGLLAGQNTNFTLTASGIGSTTNDSIGSKQSSTFSNFTGNVFEFRIYQGALTALEAAEAEALGPDQPLADPGALQALRVSMPSPTGPGAIVRAPVFADFQSIPNVNVGLLPDLVMTSSDTNVVAITPDNRLRTISVGTADITAFWGGFSNTATITVSVPHDVQLVHRYSFNEVTNDWIIHDSIGNASGRIFSTRPFPSASPDITFLGNGEMAVMGSTSGFTPSAYAQLPSGLISGLSLATIEVWYTQTQNTIAPWRRVFDFGSNSGLSGTTYFFVTANLSTDTNGYGVNRLAVTANSIGGESNIQWTNTVTTNIPTHLAITYNPIGGVAKIYVNGLLTQSMPTTLPLSSIVDTNNLLARSQFNQDAYFGGRYNELRIYSGILSDTDVAAEYVAGPDKIGSDYVLHVNPATNNSVMLTWGATATDVFLQTSTSFNQNFWSLVLPPPEIENGRFTARIPATNSAAFYRLQ